MTKFEEEHIKFNNEYGNCKSVYYQKAVRHHFKNWHSDEEFQELFDKYSNLNDNYEKEVIRSSKLESQIADLKSQLQQQALPVVPDYVAEWYEECAPITVETCITDFLFNYQKEESVENGTEFEQWFMRTDNSIEILMDMKRLGYTVEKPQLFYLKHIDMSKRDDLEDWWLSKKNFHHIATDKKQLPVNFGYLMGYGIRYLKFTQQEIDSMQTGSYEQIEVTK